MTTTINASTSAGLVNTADTSGALALQTAGTTAVYVDSSQNVGIGTTSPSTKLAVSVGTGGSTTGISTTGSGNMLNTFPSSSTNAGVILDATDGTVGSSTAVPMIFRGGGTERMRISSSGELFVGTTSLAVTDSTGNGLGWTGNRSLIVNSANGTTQALLYLDATSWTSGTLNFEQFRLNGGTTLGTITSNGSTMTYGGTSDYRLKDNIAPLTGALDKVTQLKPSSFVWKNTGIQDDGFIAHELQAICPNAVVGEKDAVDENGNPVYQQIDTSFLVATLTAAIQELTAKVTALEAKVGA